MGLLLEGVKQTSVGTTNIEVVTLRVSLGEAIPILLDWIDHKYVLGLGTKEEIEYLAINISKTESLLAQLVVAVFGEATVS